MQLVVLATYHHPGIQEHAPRCASKDPESKELDIAQGDKFCTLRSDRTRNQPGIR